MIRGRCYWNGVSEAIRETGSSRLRPMRGVYPRQVAMYLVKELTTVSHEYRFGDTRRRRSSFCGRCFNTCCAMASVTGERVKRTSRSIAVTSYGVFLFKW